VSAESLKAALSSLENIAQRARLLQRMGLQSRSATFPSHVPKLLWPLLEHAGAAERLMAEHVMEIHRLFSYIRRILADAAFRTEATRKILGSMTQLAFEKVLLGARHEQGPVATVLEQTGEASDFSPTVVSLRRRRRCWQRSSTLRDRRRNVGPFCGSSGKRSKVETQRFCFTALQACTT